MTVERNTTWASAASLQQAADLLRNGNVAMTDDVAKTLADHLEATANALSWLAPFREGEPGHLIWPTAEATAEAVKNAVILPPLFQYLVFPAREGSDVQAIRIYGPDGDGEYGMTQMWSGVTAEGMVRDYIECMEGTERGQYRIEETKELLGSCEDKTGKTCTYWCPVHGEIRVEHLKAAAEKEGFKKKIEERLKEISELQPGWLDGQGIEILNDVIHRARQLVHALPSTCHNLRLYPTVEGGISIEYDTEHGTSDIVIDKDLKLTLTDGEDE